MEEADRRQALRFAATAVAGWPLSASEILGLMPKLLLALLAALTLQAQPSGPLAWPEITREQRPWSYWWWMASAVDPASITNELTRFRDAGMGGVHIIPIYGAKGYEARYIDYLSPKWMEMLGYTVREADRLGLGVDMTIGSGWCFGGPAIAGTNACALLQSKTYKDKIAEKLGPGSTAFAYDTQGAKTDLTPRIGADGSLSWKPDSGSWTIYTLSPRPSIKVKRAGPGGEGYMLNPFQPAAMTEFLRWMSAPFDAYTGPKPRAMYHDSYEYQASWSADFLAQFELLRGYKLQDELPVFLGSARDDKTARVKSDYRETAADLLAQSFNPPWIKWAHDRGMRTRNEAHGSPGNLLDLYADADIAETEMFSKDRSTLISKFASSAAHVSGHKFVSSETGTWLKEHFTETLADMKDLLDQLFTSGVNHIFYHGTCFSPDDAPWPGWLFYASTQMNSRNAFWRDVPGLNAYAARTQAVLQSGEPDNDLLVYWPIHDLWHNPDGQLQNLTVHSPQWLDDQPVGNLAHRLWDRGYAFDFASDRQIRAAKAEAGKIAVPGGKYKAVIAPPVKHIPVETFRALTELARAGALVIFEDSLPDDVPGYANLLKRRHELFDLKQSVKLTRRGRVETGAKGRILVGRMDDVLTAAKIEREALIDKEGLAYIRRSVAGGRYYFIANRGKKRVNGWVPLAMHAAAVAALDPMTGRTGVAASQRQMNGNVEVYTQLDPGQSVIYRTSNQKTAGAPWPYWSVTDAGTEIAGEWSVHFIAGGPELPAAYRTAKLGSWTAQGEAHERFAGTARYSIVFDAPAGGPDWTLDLGRVAESARVRLNGQDLGFSLIEPRRFQVTGLKLTGNELEIEATNLSANRIRDLDRRGVEWRVFRDINFVNIDYKPFNASGWPVRESGLIGPVTLHEARRLPLQKD